MRGLLCEGAQGNGSGASIGRGWLGALLLVWAIVGSAAAWTWDVAAVRIIAPAGNVDSGMVVTPSAVVRNLGDSTASFPVVFTIGTSYTDTQDVSELGPGDSLVVAFSSWTALVRGSTLAACSTALAVDESTANDRVASTFTVRVRDVSVDRIIAPVGVVESGRVVTPQAQVTNRGTNNANFQVTFRIGTAYSRSTMVSGLAPGAFRIVSFPTWAADTLGHYPVACTAAMNNDQVPENNIVHDSCTVALVVTDVGVVRIVGPRGNIDSGAVIAPQAMVRNYGSRTLSFATVFTIGTSYADTQPVTDLGPFDSVLVTFSDWTATELGRFPTRCSTMLAGDMNPANDFRSDSVAVIFRTNDVGAVRILAPADTVDSGAVITPVAVVRNYGLTTASFPVTMRIGSSFVSTVQVTDLDAGDSAIVTFDDWTVARRGNTPASCSTALAGDQVPANDVVRKTVFRRVRDVGVTAILAPIGILDSGTVVLPRARLRNWGNVIETFPVVFRIGTFYADTQYTADTAVTFRPCTLSLVGTFSTQCSTAMTGDMVPTNDLRTDSVVVQYPTGIAGPGPVDAIPSQLVLRSIGSSLFSRQVSISYGLPRAAEVKLEVYDASGKPVSTIEAGPKPAGYHTVVWDGADSYGTQLPTGAYFVRLAADGLTRTGKIVKLD